MSHSADYSNKILEVSNLKQHFKVGVGRHKLKVKAVDGVSFDVYKKEVFGIVGESGCGKTTTGRSMIRLYRPTNGTVKLNGQIVGSGSYDLVTEIREETKAYKLKVLKLNQRKYDRYLIRQEHRANLAKSRADVEKNNKALEKEIALLEKSVLDYNNDIFENKNAFEVNVDKLTFRYNLDVENLLKQTKNEFLVEYKGLVRDLKNNYKNKVDGIKDSAALSDEERARQLSRVVEQHHAKMAALKAEFSEKIEERADHLLPKSEYKLRKNKLNADYKQAKSEYIKEHDNYVKGLSKPDYKSIRQSVIQARKKVIAENSKLRTSYFKDLFDLAKALLAVKSSNVVDKDLLKKYKAEHKAFVQDRKARIRESKKLHFSKEAETNVKNMQMIFQDPIASLNPRMTVLEIVSEGLVINGEKDKDLIKEKVTKALELVGLAPEYISRYPHEFSGGQRQRIGIARALVLDPKVIVADEPISALDVSIQAQVINLLSELKDKLDLTIVFIAHDLSVVKYFCDRIAVMYYGNMVELASSEELFKNPLHGYTQSLLSAIPQPDPDYEKQRQRIIYNPATHDYLEDKPEFVEITEGHFVLANKREQKEMRKKLGVDDHE